MGLPGALFAVLALTIREPLRQHLMIDDAGAPVHPSMRETLAQMSLRWQCLGGISAAMGFQAACTYAVGQWAGPYYLRMYHWTPRQTGEVLALMFIIFGCSGMYLGGRLADHWQEDRLDAD